MDSGSGGFGVGGEAVVGVGLADDHVGVELVLEQPGRPVEHPEFALGVERGFETAAPFDQVREILAGAADADVGLVVVGTHGREGREKRINMGSTAERVVREAERPVLVVR